MKLIALEGIDGAGKTTHAGLLGDYLKGSGLPVEHLKFPDYTSVAGKAIRSHLAGEWSAQKALPYMNPASGEQLLAPDKSNDALAFQALQLVNRIDLIPDDLWDGGREGFYIVDRFHASAYAYGSCDGLDLDWLIHIHKRMPQPHVSIMIDVSVEESVRRRPNRQDYYERDTVGLTRVQAAYYRIFEKMKMRGLPWFMIDGIADTDVVQARIRDVVDFTLQRW